MTLLRVEREARERKFLRIERQGHDDGLGRVVEVDGRRRDDSSADIFRTPGSALFVSARSVAVSELMSKIALIDAWPCWTTELNV